MVFVILAAAVLLIPACWIFAWLAAVLIHELSHFVMIRLWRKKVYGIYICPRGVIMQTESLQPLAQFFCSLAGPVGGLCLLPLLAVYPRAVLCALFHSAYNLMPLTDLDGAVALRTALELLFALPVANCCSEAIELLFCVLCILVAIYMVMLGLGWTPVLVTSVLVLRNWKIKSSCKQ